MLLSWGDPWRPEVQVSRTVSRWLFQWVRIGQWAMKNDLPVGGEEFDPRDPKNLRHVSTHVLFCFKEIIYNIQFVTFST